MKKKYKYIIIGAGVGGLTTAYELSLTNPGEVLILEKEAGVGGMCKTIKRNNAAYDMGSHRIHRNTPQKILDYIKRHADGPLLKNERGSKLILKKRFIDYPIRSYQFLLSLGIIELFLCALSLVKTKILHYFHKNHTHDYPANYQTYLQTKAGLRVYKLFYEPYAQKVWGCDPARISVTAVKKRMSMIHPIGFIKDSITHYFKKHTGDSYYYLEKGIGSFARGIETTLFNNQAKIITNVAGFTITTRNGKRIIKIHNHDSFEFEKIVSTIPLDDLIKDLTDNHDPDDHITKALKNCSWRGLKLVFLHIDTDILPPGETFYFPECTYIFGRVSIPARFSSVLQEKNDYTAVICEIPCSQDDRIWNINDGEIFKRCSTDLQKAGLLSPATNIREEKSFVINIPKVYPVYVSGWEKNIEKLLDYLNKKYPFIYSSGKPGFFLHNNMDHSIEIGLQAAEALKNGISNKAWHEKLRLFHTMRLRD